MPDRAAQVSAFLDRAGWGDARRTALAGDASNRRYERLTGRAGTAVLMDAPDGVRPFVSVARHLAGLRFSAPRLRAAEEEAGLLLLEDFGDDLFARVVERDPTSERALYESAVDVLAALHTHPPPAGPTYGPAEQALAVRLAYDWYLRDAADGAADALAADLDGLLRQITPETDVLVLRDFHAENLIWLPDRRGVARVGLLDFQDAAAGHRAYDLASLLTDVRRDVAPALRAAMQARYAAAAGIDPEALGVQVALLAAQRNLRILGTFARLSLRDGKPRYLELIPRVWRLLQADLDHPALAGLARRVRADLPPPEPVYLEQMKPCQTAPAP